jgi:hypothetical protein
LQPLLYALQPLLYALQRQERQLLPGPKIRPTQKRPMLLLVALATQLVAVQRQLLPEAQKRGETHRQKGERQERQVLPWPNLRPTQKRPLLLLLALATQLVAVKRQETHRQKGERQEKK